MKKAIAYRLATLLGLMAVFIVVFTASVVFINQPKVPNELLK